MLTAITRAVSPAISECELTFLDRSAIDYGRAAAQHRAYEECLRELGLHVISLPALPDLPDSVFVEDPAVVLDEIAVIARPGAASRQPEADRIAEALKPFRPLARIEAPGTLEGGDVIVFGDRIAIGQSARTNAAGAAVLAGVAASLGYRPFLCPVPDRLHLATAVTAVTADTLIGTAAGFASLDAAGALDPDDAAGAGAGAGASAGAAGAAGRFRRLLLPDEEALAGNVLAIDGHAFLDGGNPTASRLLRGAGLAVHELELSEFALADGGPTCLVNILP